MPDSDAGEGPALRRWLAHLEQTHPSEIELGLERLVPVADRLGLCPAPFRVLTVAGTNGKGSAVAVAEAALSASGHRVGAYTSPHLLHYGERMRLDGLPAEEARILAALEQVEAARADTPLTFFEFTTLAALVLFRDAQVTHAVLEVGLGGRLDAVNVLDADVCLITALGLDHTAWLGNTLDAIGREKAGVARAGHPAVVAMREPPAGLIGELERRGAAVLRIGQDFDWESAGEECWEFRDNGTGCHCRLHSGHAWRMDWQRDTAAGALAAVARLLGEPELPGNLAPVLEGIRLPGRIQVLEGRPETVLDVAHNPDAANALRQWLQAHPVAGRTRAVIAVRGDKDPAAMADYLTGVVDEWWPCHFPGPGGLDPAELAGALGGTGQTVHPVDGPPGSAWTQARAASGQGDRLLVLGSFLTVAAVLRAARAARQTDSGEHPPEA